MSSDQSSDVTAVKEGQNSVTTGNGNGNGNGNGKGNGNGNANTSKAFPRSPLEFGSSIIGAGSPSSYLHFKRYLLLSLFCMDFNSDSFFSFLGHAKFNNRKVFQLVFGEIQ